MTEARPAGDIPVCCRLPLIGRRELDSAEREELTGELTRVRRRGWTLLVGLGLALLFAVGALGIGRDGIWVPFAGLILATSPVGVPMALLMARDARRRAPSVAGELSAGQVLAFGGALPPEQPFVAPVLLRLPLDHRRALARKIRFGWFIVWLSGVAGLLAIGLALSAADGGLPEPLLGVGLALGAAALLAARDQRVRIQIGRRALARGFLVAMGRPGPTSPTRFEVLAGSGRLWTVDGERAAPKEQRTLVVTTAPPAVAAMAAQYLRPVNAPDGRVVHTNRRPLSAAEREELAGLARARRFGWAYVGCLLLLNLLAGAAVVRLFGPGQQDWYGLAKLGVYVVAAAAGDAYALRHELQRRALAADAALGWVDLLRPEEFGPAGPSAPELIELLPTSLAIWTADGEPAAWRMAVRSAR